MSRTSGRLGGSVMSRDFMSILLDGLIFSGFPHYMLWVGFSGALHVLHPPNRGAEPLLARGFPPCTRTWRTLQGRVKNASCA